MGKYRSHNRRRERWRLITRLMARDGETCQLCGGEVDRSIRDELHPLYITFDHRITRAAGGLTVFANLQLAHRACNETRGSDPLDESAP